MTECHCGSIIIANHVFAFISGLFIIEAPLVVVFYAQKWCNYSSNTQICTFRLCFSKGEQKVYKLRDLITCSARISLGDANTGTLQAGFVTALVGSNSTALTARQPGVAHFG